MKKPVVHLICNAHLDPVWQWRWEEGCSEALATFRTAVQLLREHPGLIFNHNEAVLYQWIKQYDPDLFREIQRLVAEERWSISGGWYLQPDVNLPGLEALFRHITEGRRFFKEHFNLEPKVAYNFDSFGHSGGLPQILRLAGYAMYIHMRPQSHELSLPSDLYRWRGVDGTEIIAYRIAVGLYHTERDNIEQRLSEGVALALRLNRDVPVFWGIGNHGGGPTREDLEKIDASIQKENRVQIVHSTPDRLYEALKDAAQHAPVVEGDLQRTFTGCYTSLSRIKRRAQESLAQLVQAEALRTATWWLRAQEYPEKELDEAWRDHLFNDFHDILPGSCTQPAEQDALDQYGRVAESVRRLRMGAAVAFNKGPLQPVYIPVTVMNANPSARRVPVEVECMLDWRPKWTSTWHLRLFDLDGNEVLAQEEQPESLLPFNDWRRKVSFFANLPAVGAANYKLEIFEGNRPVVESASALRHAIDPEGGLVRSLDAGGERECLAGCLLEPLVVDDDGDAWGSDRWSYRSIVGRFECRSKPVVIEKGPIRTITESVFEYKHSRLVVDTIAYAEWPVLEFRLRVTWNEIRKRLKLAIPTVFRDGDLLCEIPGGAIRRPPDGQEQVHGRWCMVQAKVKGRDTALGVVNSGQHGLDFLNGEIRLSVLRSAAYCHEQGFSLGDSPVRKYMDQGVHQVRLLVTAGDPDEVRTWLPGLADWLSAPPIAYAHLPIGIGGEPFRRPSPPRGAAGFTPLLTVDPPSLRMTACKRSSDGQALIVRLHEATGRETRGAVVLHHPESRVSLFFKPFEIKTLRFEKDGRWRQVAVISEA